MWLDNDVDDEFDDQKIIGSDGKRSNSGWRWFSQFYFSLDFDDEYVSILSSSEILEQSVTWALDK